MWMTEWETGRFRSVAEGVVGLGRSFRSDMVYIHYFSVTLKNHHGQGNLQKTLLCLLTPDGQSPTVVSRAGGHGHTGKSRRQRGRIVNHKGKSEKANWKWCKAFNLKVCLQWHTSLNRATPLKHLQTATLKTGGQVANASGCERCFLFKPSQEADILESYREKK